MNQVILVGRLTKDPEIKYGNNGATITRFSVAVDRRYSKEGEQSADFINCVAFGKTAEFIEKYFKKGNRIAIVGRIQTGSYKKQDGTTVYTTDVIVENVEFVESKNSSGGNAAQASSNDDGFMNIPDIPDEELPFN